MDNVMFSHISYAAVCIPKHQEYSITMKKTLSTNLIHGNSSLTDFVVSLSTQLLENGQFPSLAVHCQYSGFPQTLQHCFPALKNM